MDIIIIIIIIYYLYAGYLQTYTCKKPCLEQYCKGKVKDKAVPLQAWTDPEGSRKSRFPDFMTTAQDGGRLSTKRTGRLYPQEMLLVLISVRGWFDQRDFMSMKDPLTPTGIEPATFRIVAQHLNHCATAVPLEQYCGYYIWYIYCYFPCLTFCTYTLALPEVYTSCQMGCFFCSFLMSFFPGTLFSAFWMILWWFQLPLFIITGFTFFLRSACALFLL